MYTHSGRRVLAAGLQSSQVHRPLKVRLPRLQEPRFLLSSAFHPSRQSTSVATMSTATPATSPIQGDLNNTTFDRATKIPPIDPTYATSTLAIPASSDDPHIRSVYRPFLLPADSAFSKHDWIASLELSTVLKLSSADIAKNGRIKVLVLYGSLRERSYSRFLAFEMSRLLWRLGCDVRVYDPCGLPVKDDVNHGHPKVVELRELSKWSDGHVWVSPEQHGNLTAVFKNQIDWIPLSIGSVRPTQGRTLSILQVSGGSQSFNAVNSLRILGRWMRMFTIPNQSSVPQAWTQFYEADAGEGLDGRMKPGSLRERVVDCAEEFVKYTILMRPNWEIFGDRFSERRERERKEEREREKKESAIV